MGANGSTPSPEAMAAEKRRLEAHTVVPSKAAEKAPDIQQLVADAEAGKITDDFEAFGRFRNELLSFSLGESAFDYAERLYAAQPDNPLIMALLAETASLYDGTKNKAFKGHWVDRMDLLQRAIDVSRKCIKENPDFAPCYRTYVVAAARASESLYYYRWMKGMGLTENYAAIMKRGDQALKLAPNDAVVANTLGALNGRCSQWCYFPYGLYNWYYGLPRRSELLRRAIEYHQRAAEASPNSLAYMYHLGSAYYQNNDLGHARRCFSLVRDQMVPEDVADVKWQNAAHTTLATGFDKNRKWNMPFN